MFIPKKKGCNHNIGYSSGSTEKERKGPYKNENEENYEKKKPAEWLRGGTVKRRVALLKWEGRRATIDFLGWGMCQTYG